MEKTIQERFEKLGYIQVSPKEWQPAVLFTDELVTEDWLGVPVAWTYEDGEESIDFETFDELETYIKNKETA